MSISYQHPKVKTHVGDGFKFLAGMVLTEKLYWRCRCLSSQTTDYKNSFDVIITDSSDPEGPAEALFQKPYFQLLHDALRDGGVISTQGIRFLSRRSSFNSILTIHR